MGEANGQGIPLGIIMHCSTDSTAAEGAKERALDDFLAYYAKRCRRVKFTLSDKESSEINALRKAFPRSKHVLCFWHAIQTLQKRLADDTAPASYDPLAANKVFSFIDPTWAPGVSSNEKDASIDLTSGSVRPRRERTEEENLEAGKEVSSRVQFADRCCMLWHELTRRDSFRR